MELSFSFYHESNRDVFLFINEWVEKRVIFRSIVVLVLQSLDLLWSAELVSLVMMVYRGGFVIVWWDFPMILRVDRCSPKVGTAHIPRVRETCILVSLESKVIVPGSELRSNFRKTTLITIFEDSWDSNQHELFRLIRLNDLSLLNFLDFFFFMLGRIKWGLSYKRFHA